MEPSVASNRVCSQILMKNNLRVTYLHVPTLTIWFYTSHDIGSRMAELDKRFLIWPTVSTE